MPDQPTCTQHGTMQPDRPGTHEQAFCCQWYRCDRCTNAALIPSPALAAQLASMTGDRHHDA